jgi:protein-S-isoprenylcysteine O-methyltransferase Ste14
VGPAAEPRRPWTLDVLAAVATVGMFVASRLGGRGESDALRVIGSVALLLSALFIIPPFFLLKRYGRPESGKSYFETTRVVDRGVYRVVRHPQYLGYMLLVAGFTLHSQQLAAVMLGAAAIVLLYVHTLREERFLVEQLNGEYEVYQSAVPRFNFVVGLYRYWRRRTRKRSQTSSLRRRLRGD